METEIIKQAAFNPRIKTYVLIFVSFFFLLSIVGIPLLLIWYLGLGQYIGKRYYKSLVCKLTTNHLEFRKGVFFKVEKTIPLENIQDLTFIENPILNYFELRILKIETAGNSNPRGSDMKLVGILDSEAFKKKVLEQREVLRKQKQSNKAEVMDSETNELLAEIKNLLQDIKKNTSK